MPMIPLRTKRGKMFGMLDEDKYVIHIKDGKDKRLIQVPQEGLKLIYITGNSKQEVICIPPKQSF